MTNTNSCLRWLIAHNTCSFLACNSFTSHDSAIHRIQKALTCYLCWLTTHLPLWLTINSVHLPTMTLTYDTLAFKRPWLRYLPFLIHDALASQSTICVALDALTSYYPCDSWHIYLPWLMAYIPPLTLDSSPACATDCHRNASRSALLSRPSQTHPNRGWPGTADRHLGST